MNVNEWRDAVTMLFPHAVFNLSEAMDPRNRFGISHASAFEHGDPVGQWFEGGSWWVGNQDPTKADTVGRSPAYALLNDWT